MIFALDKNRVGFPNPRLGEEDGLLAVGGALTVEWLLTAYSYGIFPWFAFRERQIQWWCPMQRFVIFPKEIHISHSMRQLLNKGTYTVTLNKAFDQVIRGCGKAQQRDTMEGAWLGDDIIRAYTEMHLHHFAASVEVWQDDTLVGGLYGINIGRNFFGESMFSLAPSASKVALIFLAGIMEQSGGIIDCQFETPHLKSMGGRYIDYDEYMSYLNEE